MAWKELKVVDQRKLFCEAILNDKLNVSEACRQFEISRPTGYLWLNRYQTEGVKGLENLSSARLTQNNQTSREILKQILELKHRYPTWGPKKIHAKLKNDNPLTNYPGTTAIGNILSRNGLTIKRKLRRRLAENTSPLTIAEGSNDVWCMDFKGWSLTKDSHKFDPFTLTDQFSRYILRNLKLEVNNTEHVWALLCIAFREYGLPLILRSDNGPPFASTAPGRFSTLSVRLVKAGVRPEWIEPGKPQQNGQHERMHLTMKKEGILTELLLEDQIRHLEKFQEYFNFERPHEALGQKTPGSIYVPSIREWNGRLQAMEYSSEYQLGKVRSCGKMAWKSSQIYISPIFHGEVLGIKEGKEGLEVYFGPYLLGRLINGTDLEVKRRAGRQKYIKVDRNNE
jgi:putative transposase